LGKNEDFSIIKVKDATQNLRELLCYMLSFRQEKKFYIAIISSRKKFHAVIRPKSRNNDEKAVFSRQQNPTQIHFHFVPTKK
jgi:hypothetical protein